MTRILVADDDQDVRAAVCAALEIEGYEVARHAGADVTLRKPFTPGELLDKLRYYVLEHSAARQEK